MAVYTALDIQNRLEEIVGHQGLDSFVLNWINMVVRDIATRVPIQASVDDVDITLSDATEEYSLIVDGSKDDVVQIISVLYSTDGTTRDYPLKRVSLMDFFKRMDGRAETYAGEPLIYTVTRLDSTGGDPLDQAGPVIQIWPVPATAGSRQVTVKYVRLPAAIASSGDTNEFIAQWFPVVLSGVLRIARLMLGDGQGYMAEKLEFERGLSDLIVSQSAPADRSNVLRAAENPWLNR